MEDSTFLDKVKVSHVVDIPTTLEIPVTLSTASEIYDNVTSAQKKHSQNNKSNQNNQKKWQTDKSRDVETRDTFKAELMRLHKGMVDKYAPLGFLNRSTPFDFVNTILQSITFQNIDPSPHEGGFFDIEGDGEV